VAKELTHDRSPISKYNPMEPVIPASFNDDILSMTVDELIQDRLSKSKSPT